MIYEKIDVVHPSSQKNYTLSVICKISRRADEIITFTTAPWQFLQMDRRVLLRYTCDFKRAQRIRNTWLVFIPRNVQRQKREKERGWEKYHFLIDLCLRSLRFFSVSIDDEPCVIQP